MVSFLGERGGRFESQSLLGKFNREYCSLLNLIFFSKQSMNNIEGKYLSL